MALSSVKGGDKLKAKLDEIKNKLGAAPIVEVGFLEGATYPDARGTPVAMVAAIQEYGAPGVGIPPRPFFRSMITKEKTHWGTDVQKLMKANNNDVHKVLDLMGEVISGELRESIINMMAPALSPVTIMLRDMKSMDQSLVVTRRTVWEAIAKVKAGESNHGASTKPLIETGHLLDSIGHKVID